MQTLIRARQQIRERVQANEFVELDRYFDRLQSQWQQAPSGECPAYLEAVQGHMLVDWDVGGSKALTQLLKAWIYACPKAYHPQVAMGFHCFNRACRIRGIGAADAVSQERRLAAEQACELGAAHFLRAMERSPQPVAAAIGMLQICAHFHEPGWLGELFRGQVARFRPNAHADVEVQEAAAPLLVNYGLAPLVELPQALPGCLEPRLTEGERAKDYWLRQALAWRPGCFEAVEACARYLTPRWGGSYEAIDELAGGPHCQNWDERLRNAIRWLAVEDAFWLPKADQSQHILAWQQTFEAWVKHDLRAKERATLLALRGALRYASLRDCPGALPDFVASVELYPDQGFVEAIGEPFHSFVCLVLFHGGQNVTAALRIAIERLCENRRQVAACALRAAGHQFGLWGFRQSAEQAQLWLDAAVNRQRGREGLGFDVLEVPRLLWAANLHEAAYFLYQQCAERKLPEAAAALYALHCGRLADTPDHYRDAASAAHWLLCAAQSGSQMAKYDLACQRMRDGDGLDERRAMLSVRRMLLDCLGNEQLDGRARLQLGILQRLHGDVREREEGVAFLLELVAFPDAGIAGRACAELGLAWMQGQGTRKQSRFAAIEWANRAVALQPDDPVIEQIRAQILNAHSVVKTFITVCGATLFRGDLEARDLPPTAGGSRSHRQRASA
ncbi:DUF4034 domain-containing protein [Pseudomonas plecoglossicida]|uniref:DUF4034 domain-containing protein n=1 Tax=Pseudomonas plecoglossicida TaxID=70775 RepID=A0AAD0QXE9_PSEDL|nr:DUF4034 domain-containing protein [Pseudomonas plecoglossicida]AXM97463.1 DUF4034 domain-containing protein [Pseudomonas plecoglossicida]EPB94782.1 hypothetical protein L321_16233 [Pseudomonas plecoglossicida NB2011]QLB57759.1 DUF4034 domain-containing protein [Pseudomonas plecoglossicida]GLR36972.1 hypothetical protein GCM10011247_23690 [Pseudomonas plecoglossicida]